MSTWLFSEIILSYFWAKSLYVLRVLQNVYLII